MAGGNLHPLFTACLYLLEWISLQYSGFGSPIV